MSYSSTNGTFDYTITNNTNYIRFLEDTGYTVNYNLADVYNVLACNYRC
jgi:hypothetical protein